jgi:antitoxin component YwqK of YwqJK toxin-antitoxin module
MESMKLESEFNLKGGKAEKTYKTYYENGALLSNVTIKNGKLEEL